MQTGFEQGAQGANLERPFGPAAAEDERFHGTSPLLEKDLTGFGKPVRSVRYLKRLPPKRWLSLPCYSSWTVVRSMPYHLTESSDNKPSSCMAAMISFSFVSISSASPPALSRAKTSGS